jgi:hypothetical protein
MLQTASASMPAIVRPSDNGTSELRSIYQSALADVRATVEAQARVDYPCARLIVAGAMMAAIRERDPEAWERFVGGSKASVKGANAHYRAIAAILWQTKSVEPSNRERISTYGKAICVVHEDWEKSPKNIDKRLVERVARCGLRGMVKLYAIGRGKPLSSPRVSVAVRNTAVVYVVRPDRQVIEVEPGLARYLIDRVLQ